MTDQQSESLKDILNLDQNLEKKIQTNQKGLMSLLEVPTFQLSLKIDLNSSTRSIPNREFINSENLFIDSQNRLFLSSEISLHINDNQQEIIFNVSGKKTELLMKLLELFDASIEVFNE